MGERDKKNKLIYKTDKKFHAKQMHDVKNFMQKISCKTNA